MSIKSVKNRPINLVHEEKAFISSSSFKTSNDRRDDSKLWMEFKLGNENAFQIIYEKNASALYDYGLKITHMPNLVKDCIQDLFVDLWNTKQRLGEVKAIRPYLYKSFRRRLKSMMVKNKYVNLDFNSHSLIEPSHELKLIEKQIFDRKLKCLKEVMLELTDRQKEIIHLKYYGGLSYAEISEVMVLSPKAVYKLMGRAIKYLRQNII